MEMEADGMGVGRLGSHTGSQVTLEKMLSGVSFDRAKGVCMC